MALTLAEAAREVLDASRAGAPKEGIHKMADTGSHLDTVHDLGGSTYKDPQGKTVGDRASDSVGTATPPGTQPDAGSKEPIHKLDKGNGQAAASGKPGDTSLEDAESDTGVKVDNMAPTSFSEDVELTPEQMEEARKARWDEMKEQMKKHSVKEDIDALFSGETLSEEFRNKATTIFEAAVLTRAITVAESLEKDILTAAEEAIEETRSELEEQIDSYLNFVVEKWVSENEVAIESGLRSEIVEDFISGLKNLFSEHYVEIPEDKFDVVEAQAGEIEELKAKVNEVLNTNIELNKQINSSKKNEILASVCEGLTATQAEKVKMLAEGVEFTTEGDYTKKVQVIKESYTNASKKTGDETNVVALTESTGPAEVQETHVDPTMARYVAAISRTQK